MPHLHVGRCCLEARSQEALPHASGSPAATDAELLAELINERGLGARGFGITGQGAWKNIAKSAGEAEENGIGLLAVRRRAGGDFIALELFCRAHGQGYATEAAVAVIEAAPATGPGQRWQDRAASRGGWAGDTRTSQAQRRAGRTARIPNVEQ